MQKKSPPRIPSYFIKRFVIRYTSDPALGDLDEEFQLICNESGNKKARQWYWEQFFRSLPFLINNLSFGSMTLLKNYFKIAFRNIRRHKLYSFINITGLSIGISCCILVSAFIKYELSYDMFHQNADCIFRLTTERQLTYADRWIRSSLSPAKIGPAMEVEFPEVIKYVRVKSNAIVKALFRNKEKSFFEDSFYAADPTFFEFFSFPLIAGDPKTVLDAPNSVVITESIANKYFGNENPMGKTFSVTAFNTRFQKDIELTITGIMRDIQDNSHIKFNMLGSLKGAESVYEILNIQSWTIPSFYTYVMLHDKNSCDTLGKKLSALKNRIPQNQKDREIRLHVEPLSAAHRTPELIRYLYTIACIAFIILIIACINFVNLTTAKSLTRSKEVGIRKVIGARRSVLVIQFIGETFLFAVFSLFSAAILIKLLFPLFNILTNKKLEFDLFSDPIILFISIILTIVVGFLSGLYPGFFLSSFNPVSVIIGNKYSKPRRSSLRNFLVIFQYVVSVVFIIGTIIVVKQMRYLTTRELGLNSEQIINIHLSEKFSKDRLDNIKSKIISNPNILSASYATTLPFNGTLNLFAYPMDIDESTLTVDDIIFMDIIYCEYDFLKTLGIELESGRDFSRDFPADEIISFIINKPAAEAYNLDFPLGGNIKYSIGGGRKSVGKVIGLVKDFHFMSFDRKIGPIVLAVMPPLFNDYYRFITVKVQSGKIRDTLGSLKQTIRSFAPDDPFEYTFYDETVQSLFENDKRLMRSLLIISSLAIFIASLGLIGLTTYISEQRLKEIGIRKVLGATSTRIFSMISRQFLKLVIIGNFLGWPGAYFLLNTYYLQNYVYRTTFGWETFALTGIITLILSSITIFIQMIKPMLANPVDSLRYE
ncbi:ABC transporter permease [candidate division KSB1 bacterium]